MLTFFNFSFQLQTTTKSKSSDGTASPILSSTTTTTLHKDFHSTPTLPTENPQTELFQPKNPETSNTVVERNAKNAKSFAADFEFGPGSMTGVSLNDRDAKVGDMRGYFTLPGRHKKMLEEGGSYRAVTKIRPVATRQISFPSATSAAPPPPDHPPPPPPATQVVTVEPKQNSDYAKVCVKSPDRDAEMSPRSSFKPMDNAKLYASPENVQSVVFRSEEESPTHRNASSGVADAVKKRSPTRANSMPPRPNRPQVLKRVVAEVPLAAPSPAAAPAAVETYSVNGVNYTTYTTFRSPMTPDDPPPNELAADSEDLTPTAERLLNGPVIPEPDYDQSDHEYNGSECSGSQYNGFRSSSVDETPSRTLEKKKKKSVSFVMNEEVAAKLQQQQRNTAKKQQESILKDPQRDRDRQVQQQQQQQQQQQEWTRAPLVKEKYMQPIEKIPMARLRFEPTPQYNPAPALTAAQQRVQFQIVSQQELPVLQKIRVSDEDKIRIEVPPVVPAKTALARSNSSASSSNAAAHAAAAANKLALHKSQSFCAEKLQAMPMPVALPSPVEAVGPISESDIQKARSQLKPSRSFPHDFKNSSVRKVNENSVNNEEGDNSSSGVSSDQENGSTGKFVTYLPVDGGATSTVPDNASESSDDVSEKSWILRAEQDPMGHSIISMKKMLHPKLQAIFDAPLANSQNKLMTSSAGPVVMQSHLEYTSPYTTQTLPNRGHHHHNKNASKSVLSDERSIDQSLALINQHVNKLNKADAVDGNEIAVLAPPPGFSDSESMSDNESLSSSGSQRRFGIRGIPKSSRNLPVQSSLTDQLKKERMTTNMMSRSMDSSHLMSANFATMPRKPTQQQQQQMLHATTTREFRTKPLIGWTVVDVCDWLDSLFMSEYKAAFIDNEVDGLKLASMTKKDLESLGVIRIGHTMNIEKSLKRYLSPN